MDSVMMKITNSFLVNAVQEIVLVILSEKVQDGELIKNSKKNFSLEIKFITIKIIMI